MREIEIPFLIICNLKVCLCCILNGSEKSSDNSRGRSRTGLRQRVLLMSRAYSLRHSLMPAPLAFLMLEPPKEAALSAVGTAVPAEIWAPGSTQMPGTPKLCCELESQTVPPGLELKRKVWDSRWLQNQQTHTNTPENRWESLGRVSITGVTWSSLEQQLCCECSWIGWVVKALQKRMAGRKL